MIPIVLIGQVAQLAGEIPDLGIEVLVLLLELLLFLAQVPYLVTERGVQQHQLLLVHGQVLHLGIEILHPIENSGKVDFLLIDHTGFFL